MLAGVILEIGEVALAGTGRALAEQTLADGSAWKKFQRICDAQGGMRTPPTARLTHPIVASHSGRVTHIENRRIARLARSEEHTSALQSIMRLSYAVFLLKKNIVTER